MKPQKETINLAILVIALIITSAITNYKILLCILAISFLLCTKKRLKVAKQSFIASFIFSFTIYISYSIFAYFNNNFNLNFLLQGILRTYTMTFFIFWFIQKNSIYKAFSFSKEFTFLLILTISKIIRFKKLYYDFIEVLISRGAKNKNLSYQFLASTITMFLIKMLQDGIENTEAMKMRGLDV